MAELPLLKVRCFTPQLPADPGTPKDAVQRLFDQAGGVKRVAVRLGYRGASQVYAFAHPAETAEITFAQVAALTEAGSPAAAEYLALLAGGAYVPVAASQEPLGMLTADALKESAEACAELARASIDDVLTRAEARAAIPEIEEAIRRFVQLHAAVAARAKDAS